MSLPARITQRLHVQVDGCITWSGAHQSAGYGHAWWQGTTKLVHRLMYELLVGEVPAGTELDHLCRNRACCNPLHLEAVTHRENCLRGASPIADLAKRTHCLRGHSDWLVTKRGARSCRPCHDERCRNYQRRKRELISA